SAVTSRQRPVISDLPTRPARFSVSTTRANIGCGNRAFVLMVLARRRMQFGGAGFKSLKDTWADTTSPHGWLMFTVQRGANYGIFPALPQPFFLDIGATARALELFNEASSCEKILSELFSGIWGPDCRYRCNGLNFRPNLGTVRTSPSSVGISGARPTPQHRWEANPN